MRDDKRPWGFWFPILNAEDARYAAKMAGLPVFLAGLWSSAASVATLIMRPGWASAAILVIGCLFIVAGLLIRKGRLNLVPALVPLYIALITLNVTLVFVAFSAIGKIIVPTVNVLAPLLTSILCINGVRGWLWLRRYGT